MSGPIPPRNAVAAVAAAATLLLVLVSASGQAAPHASRAAAPGEEVPARPEPKQAPASPERLRDILDSPTEATPAGMPAPDSASPSVWRQECGQGPGAVLEACRAALTEYYVYRRLGLEHRQKVFAWQHRSSIAIFVAVLLLVASGIYFAAVQFHHGLRQPRGLASAQLATELEASMKGIKVSSPVLGVVTLVISLAFFYLYLAFVYPIKEIF